MYSPIRCPKPPSSTPTRPTPPPSHSPPSRPFHPPRRPYLDPFYTPPSGHMPNGRHPRPLLVPTGQGLRTASDAPATSTAGHQYVPFHHRALSLAIMSDAYSDRRRRVRPAGWRFSASAADRHGCPVRRHTILQDNVGSLDLSCTVVCRAIGPNLLPLNLVLMIGHGRWHRTDTDVDNRGDIGHSPRTPPKTPSKPSAPDEPVDSVAPGQRTPGNVHQGI